MAIFDDLADSAKRLLADGADVYAVYIVRKSSTPIKELVTFCNAASHQEVDGSVIPRHDRLLVKRTRMPSMAVVLPHGFQECDYRLPLLACAEYQRGERCIVAMTQSYPRAEGRDLMLHRVNQAAAVQDIDTFVDGLRTIVAYHAIVLDGNYSSSEKRRL